jgi:hypothetical protein
MVMYRFARRAAGLAVVLAIATAGVAVAAQGGAGTETSTEHLHEVVLIHEEEAVNPCTGEKGLLVAAASNAKEHTTTHADGDRWVTRNAEGTATFTPTSPEGAAYSGHFHLWDGESLNNKNHVEHETGTFVLKAANGSKITVHMVGHVSTNGKGEPTVEFHTQEVHCGG